MMHLNAEQMIDAAEGLSAASSAAHLRVCEACRAQVADLQRVRAAASAGGDVPEPSPLFWDHFSARVHDAIADEPLPRAAWWRPSAWPWIAMPAGAGALIAIVLAIVLTSRLTPMHAPAPPVLPVAETTPLDPASDDGPLSLVADLAAQMDFDTVNEISMPVHTGALDEAIGDLSAGERVELQRLLQELARPGA